MTDIKLTPENLLAQSNEMKNLQVEYENLFTKASSVLNAVNECWSSEIANNFAGKISGAQKDFSSISNMLTNGATAARVSAMTFSHPNTVLALQNSTGGVNGGNQFGIPDILTSEEKQQIIDMLPENLKKGATTAVNLEKWLASEYNNLPPNIRKSIKAVLPSNVQTTISIINEVSQGKANYETIGKAVTAVTGDSTKGKFTPAVLDAAIKASYMEGNHDLAEAGKKYEALAGQALRNGDAGNTIKYISKAYGAECLNGLKKIGYGYADAVTNIAGAVVDGATKKPLNIVSKIVSGIPGDIGDTLREGVSVTSNTVSGVSSFLWNLL